MIILGIDPGIATTGWGVVEKVEGKRVNGKDFVMLDYGCVLTEPNLSLSERLELLYSGIQNVLREHKPAAVAVEELFFTNNAKTVMAVGQARGVILLAAQHFKVPFFEYTPPEVKSALTGYGRADKSQMQRMIQLILALTEMPKPDDAADALAIAYCHGVNMRG